MTTPNLMPPEEQGTPVYELEKTRVVRQRIGLTTIAIDEADALARLDRHINLSGAHGWQFVDELPDYDDLVDLVRKSRVLVLEKIAASYDIEYWESTLQDIDAAIAKADAK